MRHRTAVAILVLASWLLSEVAVGQGQITIPGYSIADAARAVGIGLVGPTEANVGQEITIRMTGTPALDLSEPLIGQLDWLMGDSRMFVFLAAPHSPLAPLEVRGELVFGAAGATMQPLIRVECKEPGEYRLLIDWNHGQNQLAEHRVMVGGKSPEPEPDPKPDPIPPPPGPLAEMWVIVVEETSQRTPEQAWVLLDPTVRQWMKANGHHLRIVDKDQTASDLAEWIGRALAKNRKGDQTAPRADALPYLFVVDDSGSVVFEGALPSGPIQMLELVKKWGAEK